jgi:N-acetylmuramoyl-L-alanine amidase
MCIVLSFSEPNRMGTLHVIRCCLSYAALLGAALCLWQVQSIWDRQSLALRSESDAWMDILRDHLVIVDAGHGGTDGGTQGHGVLEKKCSLEIAKRVENHLRSRGIRTMMTRSDDSYVELTERSAIANRNNASLFLSIHLNADGTSDETAGIETYYCSRKRLGDLVKLRDQFDIAPGQVFKDGRSEWLARIVQRAVCAATGAADRRARDSNYLVVMQAECPAVLVECGYLTNESESRRISGSGYQEKIAAAIAESAKHFLLATDLHPRRGLVFDSTVEVFSIGTMREGNP